MTQRMVQLQPAARHPGMVLAAHLERRTRPAAHRRPCATRRSPENTLPARISAWARARLSARPRSVSSRSARWRTCRAAGPEAGSSRCKAASHLSLNCHLSKPFSAFCCPPGNAMPYQPSVRLASCAAQPNVAHWLNGQARHAHAGGGGFLPAIPERSRRTGEIGLSVPLKQMVRVGAYVLKQHLSGNKRYPLVLMLEPLFRCNLACAGCGKIDYPEHILNQRLSLQECLGAVDECGAPVVSIAGGEPLLHKEMPEIVAGHRGAQEVRLPVHQRAAARKEASTQYKPNPVLRLVDPSRRRPADARPFGVARTASTTGRGGDQGSEEPRFPRQHQLHAVQRRRPGARRRFLRHVQAMGVDGITSRRATPMNARRTSSTS